jgi:hypothetical protein
MNSTF